jgi:predicted nucleotidyltransferase
MNKTIQEIKEKIIPILKEHKVARAGIFGSYARGEQKKKSDVDILVEINDNRSLLEIIGLKLVLEKCLKKKVDIVEYELIRKELKDSILNDEIKIL